MEDKVFEKEFIRWEYMGFKKEAEYSNSLANDLNYRNIPWEIFTKVVDETVIYLANETEQFAKGFRRATQSDEISKYLAKGWHEIDEETYDEIQDDFYHCED